MQENNFEQQVHQTMDTFQVPPSDEVWNRVAQSLEKDKRRRAVWWWMAALVMLIGGGVIWMVQPTNQYQPQAVLQPSNKLMPEPDATTESIKQTAPNQPPVNQSEPKTPAKQILLSSNINSEATQQKASDKFNQSLLPGTKDKLNRKKWRGQQKGLVDGAQPVNDESRVAKKTGRSTTKAMLRVEVEAASPEEEDAAESVPVNDAIAKGIAQQSAINLSISKHSDSAQQTVQSVATTIPSDSALTTKKEVNQPSHKKLHWFVKVGAGVVGFHHTTQNNLPLASQNSGTGTGVVSPDNSSLLSKSLPTGWSVPMSVNLQWPLGKRSSLSTGFQYQLIQAGQYVARLSADANGSYTSAGNNFNSHYTNRFHFIGLPIQWNYQLLPKAQHNWQLQLGVVPTYLLHTNALQYNAGNNTYYRNDDLFNRFQWSLTSSIQYNLHGKDKKPLYLGVDFQPTFTKLAGSGLYGNARMNYIGLSLQKNW